MGAKVLEAPDAGLRAISRIVRISIVVALSCALLPLLGWLLDLPVLQGFGLRPRAWPVTAVGLLVLALALFAMVVGTQRRYVVPPLALPFLVGCLALYDHATGRGLSLEGWLFADRVSRVQVPEPGQTGTGAAIALVLLSVAVGVGSFRSTVAGRISVLMGSLGLSLGAMALAMVPQNLDQIPPELRYLPGSLPTSLSILALSVGLLAWRAEAGWRYMLASSASEWRIARLLFPLLLISPAAAVVIELAAHRVLSYALAEMISAALNIVVVAGLLIWSTTRAIRQGVALQQLTAALDSAPVAITDLDGRITHWSQGCEDLFGWSADAAVGSGKYTLLVSRCADSGDAASLPNDHVPTTRELAETRQDGTVVRVLEQVRRIDRPGLGPLLVLSMTDISARVQAEDALRDSEARLALATNVREMGIFEWDMVNGNFHMSAGSERCMGLVPGTIRNFADWAELVVPEDVETIEREIERAIAEKSSRFDFRLRVPQSGLPERIMEGASHCFYDAKGAPVRIVGITIDTTDQVERKAALQAREAQLRSIIETVPDAMVIIDTHGTIRNFSQAAERLFGHRANHAVGQNITMLMRGEDSQSHKLQLARYLRTGERNVIGRTRNVTALHADGHELPVELWVGEAVIAGERLFTGFLRDISERLAADERLGQLRDELTHMGRITAMGEMAAGLAHELNQPLTAIANSLATAEMLLKVDGGEERLSEVLDLTRSQAVRAGEIIRRLREFISTRASEMRYEPVESTLREAVALVIAGQHHADFRIAYDLDPNMRRMLANRVQIQQVLVNLLRNSIEALQGAPRDRREIVIATRAIDHEMMEISIRDTGIGITPFVLSRLFQPFTSNKGDDGMGIGLSISRRIVEAHGGNLVADNLPGEGACFRFTVPIAHERETQK